MLSVWRFKMKLKFKLSILVLSIMVVVIGGMNEMAVGAEQINIAVHQVNDLSGKNRENIDLLVKEVSRFKVE